MQAVKPKRLEPLTQASPSKVFAKPGSLQTYLPHHAAPQQPPRLPHSGPTGCRVEMSAVGGHKEARSPSGARPRVRTAP